MNSNDFLKDIKKYPDYKISKDGRVYNSKNKELKASVLESYLKRKCFQRRLKAYNSK